ARNKKSRVCHHATRPKAKPASANGACIAAPRLYDGFHSASNARSSRLKRAGCSTRLTKIAAPEKTAATINAKWPAIITHSPLLPRVLDEGSVYNAFRHSGPKGKRPISGQIGMWVAARLST